MKLEQMGRDETIEFFNIGEREFLLMILKRLERIEEKIDKRVEDAIRERLGLFK